MTPNLFPAQAREQFIRVTGDRYNAMKKRLAKKKIPLTFSLVDMREHILTNFMGGKYDGAIQCRYCFKVCDISETAFDHAIPLVRGGSPDLPNIEAPCAACNDRKGDMTPDEFDALLKFLFNEMPMVRVSILKRLQEHGKLLAGKRRNEMLARKGGQPAKTQKPGKPPLVPAMDDNF